MTTRPARSFFALALFLASLPLAAAGRPIAPRELGQTPFHATEPQTAYAGGRFLTVWYEAMGFLGTQLFGAFSDANGVRISPRAFHLDVPPAATFTLAGAGDSFALFWPVPGGARMADVDLQGRITGVRTIALPEYVVARFAWNGTHFMTALVTAGDLDTQLAVLDRGGRLIVPPVTILEDAHATDVAAAGGRFVAVWSALDAVYAHQVTPEGLGARITVKQNGPSASGMRPHSVLARTMANGDVLVIWGTGDFETAELRSTVVRRDGTVGADSRLARNTYRLTPLELLRSGDGYLLAYTSGPAGNDPGALWTLRLDAAGKAGAEPVRVTEGVTSFGLPIPAAASSAAILVAYQNNMALLPAISAVAIGADGAARSPQLLSVRETRQAQPVLGAGGGSVLAAWTEVGGGEGDVRAAPVSADGQPGPAAEVASKSVVAREMAWNGVHHLVVHVQGKNVVATRVTADGRIIDDTPLLLARYADFIRLEPAVVWAGTRWIVVWAETDRLQSVTVSSDGTRSPVRTLDVHLPLAEGWIRRVSQPALAWDGDDVLLAWSEQVSEPCWHLCFNPAAHTFATRLTRTGAEHDLRPVDLDVSDAPSLSVASSGTEFLVVAGQHARVVESGAELRVATRRDLFDWRVMSDVTWDGTTYAVALRYFGWARTWYLGLLRLDRAGNDAAVRRGTVTLTPNDEAAPSIAAPVAGDALIGVHEGTVADGVSAVTYRERDLAPLPPPPGAPRNVQFRTAAGGTLDVSWDAPADGDPDGYVIEQFIAGMWRLMLRVPGNVRQANVSRYHDSPSVHVRIRAFGLGGPSAPADQQSGQPRRRSVR
jgi:hypothetical protein